MNFGCETQVKKKTLSFFNKKFHKNNVDYSPWMSMSPLLENDELFFQVNQLSFQRGTLLVSCSDLTLLDTFFKTSGKRIGDDLNDNSFNNFQICKDLIKFNSKADIIFSEAKKIVLESSSYFEVLFDELVDIVIPLDYEYHIGISSDLARGAIFLSIPNNYPPIKLAIDLVHEFGHQVLMIFNSADPFFISGQNKLIFSGVRNTERPAIQSYHAAVALAYMSYFSKCYLEKISKNNARSSFLNSFMIDCDKKLDVTIKSLIKNCSFTEIGAKILQDFYSLTHDKLIRP